MDTSSLFHIHDVLFSTGEIPANPQMYIVKVGAFEYSDVHDDTTTLTVGQYISEAALWVHWVHRGTLRAFQDCQVYFMDAGAFATITCQFAHDCYSPHDYATSWFDYIK